MSEIALVVVAWAALGAVLFGIGAMSQRLLGARRESIQTWDATTVVLTGWAGMVAFLQLWHCWLPVNSWATAACVVLGAAGLYMSRPMWPRRIAWDGRWNRCGLFAIVLLGVWLANQSVDQPRVYDSGLYHVSAVRWSFTQPVTPGLVLVHERLAWNNTYFLYAAALNVGPFIDRYHHVVSGFLILLALIRCVQGWVASVKTPSVGPRGVFDALFLGPIVAWTMHNGCASSPSPDVANYVMGFFVASELVDMLFDSGKAGASPGGWRVSRLAILCAVAVTNKLTFAVFGGGACLLGIRALAAQRPASREWANVAVTMVAIGLVTIVPWMARGVLLSGYPLFPSTVGGVDVEWRCPVDGADNSRDAIRAWARVPGPQSSDAVHGWRWVWPWFTRVLRVHFGDVLAPLTLGLVGIAGWWRLRGWRHFEERRVAFLPVVVFVALAFWFFMAPDPRFVGSLFWVVGATGLSLYICRCGRRAGRAAIAVCTVMVLVHNVNPVETLLVWRRDPGPLRKGEVTARRTSSGLTVYVPASGDQCWDAPLPCGPAVNSRLRLREPGNMRSGFVLAPVGQ
jgi:hypothetical protein